MHTEQRLRSILHEHDMKHTKMRAVVLDLMLTSDTAMSHSQISQSLDEKGYDIDKVTLYRTLNTFVEKNLAHKVPTEDRNWLYAIYDHDAEEAEHGAEHAHFVCTDCEKIYCFPLNPNAMSVQEDDLQGFEVKQTEIRLHGRCPVCQ